MLALSTRCAPEEQGLDRAVESLLSLDVRALALHRPPEAEEAKGLARWSRRIGIVAVFGGKPAGDVGRPVLVLEGGAADEDREASLERLCRRLHALRAFPLALLAPAEDGHHPTPAEFELVRGEVRQVGYWHDCRRAGEAYLESAARFLCGASFHPLETEDLAALRAALPSAAPAVVDCEPATPHEELREALARARGYFHA